MKELLLDAETLYTREQLHDVLAKVCGFPADYGRNLDALYDLLTAYPAARLTLRHPEMLVAHLGNYGELVLRVLADAAGIRLGFLFIPACLQAAPAWQDFVQKSEPLAPPQRTARKRAYNRKRRSMPPLFIKSRDMCVGFYTSKGFCVPAKRTRRIPPQTCPSYCSACPPRSRAWS